MRLSEKAIQEFKELYLKEQGVRLSTDEAREKAESFIALMEIIGRPIPGVDYPIEVEQKESPE